MKKYILNTKFINKIDASDSNFNFITNSFIHNPLPNKNHNNDYLFNLNHKNNLPINKLDISDSIANLKLLKNQILKINSSRRKENIKNKITDTDKTKELTINSNLIEIGLINHPNGISEKDDNNFYIKYNVREKFILTLRILYLVLFIAIIMSILIVILIDNYYTSISDFYMIKNAIVRRNSVLFDSLFFLKITTMNKESLVFDIFWNSTYYNIFDKSIETLDYSSSTVKEYYNKNKLDQLDLQTIKFLEKSLQTKYICEYYSYYANSIYLIKFSEKINQIPDITLEHLEALKNIDTNYDNRIKECRKNSGNLFNSVLYEFLNFAKYLLTNSMADFHNYEKNRATYNKTNYLEFIKSYFCAETIIKVNYNLRNILYWLVKYI